MPADLDALLTHVYVLVDDLLPRRRQRGRPVRISDSELICLAIAQVLPLAARRGRQLRLLSLAPSLLLGLPALSLVRAGRDADRLRARSRHAPSVWSRPSFSSARSNRDRRSSATRALPGGVRAARGLVESAHPASRPAQRAGALRLARRRPPVGRVGLPHAQGPTLARAPRGSDARWPRQPRRPSAAGARRRDPAQLVDRRARTEPRRLPH